MYANGSQKQFMEVLYVYLFWQDSYFSRIRAESSALIHEYANILNTLKCIKESSRSANSWLR